MLKVLKSHEKITAYRDEFAAIRHGDYLKFINLVKGPMPFMVVYHEGNIASGHLPPQEDDIDFALLLKSEPSLKIFYANCLHAYGPISDPDLSDNIFELAVVFEISLRMCASNNKLADPTVILSEVIDRVCTFKNFTSDELSAIHLGRKFLNMIKHKKNQFPTWSEGANALKTAYDILKGHQLAD